MKKFLIGFFVAGSCTLTQSGFSKTGIILSIVVGLISGSLYCLYGKLIA